MSRPDHLKALVVELIRRLWHRGLLSRTNKIASQIHDTWFSFWVEYKTAQTMADLDEQIEDVLALWEDDEDPALDAYVYSEQVEGETPLGGEMRVRHRAQD